MPKTWFTADTHFGHSAIIGYCGRPCRDVGEMDRELVAHWNSVVRPSDEVWHLGDFCLGGPEVAESYLKRLNGKTHLVWGNHDKTMVRQMPCWQSSQAYAEIKVDGVRLVLLHYGLRVWPGSNRGSVHLYGHSHGKLPGDRQCVDVGVDYPAWHYRPVSLQEIQRHLATLPERGHGKD